MAKAPRTPAKPRKPRTAPAQPSAPAPGPAAPAGAVPQLAETIAVRMYRGLLGDCFLLTHRRGDRVFRTLLDCGVLQAIGSAKPETKAGIAHMASVVQNLLTDCGGVLDLVVATHEHYDHLSGFIVQFDLWRQFTIRQVWLAWTENYADPLANDIRLNRSKGLATLSALVDGARQGQAFGLDADELEETVSRVEDLLQFYGDIEPVALNGQALTGAAAPDPAAPTNPRPAGRPPKVPPVSCLDVLDWLKSRPDPGQVRYLEPGQQIRFGIDDRLRATVLGPPRTRDRLLQLDPSKGSGREVYLVQPGDVSALAKTLAMRADDAAGAPAGAGDYPFADRFRRWEDSSSSDPLALAYYAKDAGKRRIDGEWLGSAETLALKIDGDVNNTSLAIAVEVPGRDVLLFPGDAQVGNWLSWHDQKYPAKPQPGVAQETAEQLLGRVVFYKVGHHASHNATAREKGLEMMLSPDLVAMIPVVEAVAREQKTKSNPDGWAMPYRDLYTRLTDKTRGRIVRGDGDVTAETATFAAAPGRFALAYESGAAPLWAEVTMAVPTD